MIDANIKGTGAVIMARGCLDDDAGIGEKVLLILPANSQRHELNVANGEIVTFNTKRANRSRYSQRPVDVHKRQETAEPDLASQQLQISHIEIAESNGFHIGMEIVGNFVAEPVHHG